jgi:Rhodopirellula transposase DDE domain
VISVDAKKKELIGNYKNEGQDWQLRETPIEVKMHDFMDKQTGKVIPYGVYDITENQGWVTVGIDHDTAQFAVASGASTLSRDQGTDDYRRLWGKQ